MRYLKYVAVSAVSAGVTFFLTRNQPSSTPKEPLISSNKKKEKPVPTPEISIKKDKQKTSVCIQVKDEKKHEKVNENLVKPAIETKHDPVQIDRSMFPMEFGGKKKQYTQRKPRSRRNNGRRWTAGDEVQWDNSWNHSQEKKSYDASLAGKSTADLRTYHRKKFLELVVKLPAEYQEKYAVDDWEISKEAKKKILHEKKPVNASTFGESLTFLEYSLGKLAKAHQKLTGLAEPIAPPSQDELDSMTVNNITPSQIFNSILEKTHNCSNMLEQIRVESVDADDMNNNEEEKDIKTLSITHSPLKLDHGKPPITVTSDAAAGGVEKALTLDEINKLDNDVAKHYLAYLGYARQIILDWRQRNRKLRPKPEALKIRLKEMTMEEQKEWLKILPPDPSIPIKFWYQRLRLFSKYEEGIRLDTEGWFSTTPELIARMIARRLGKGVVLDAMCGAGGNTIQMALHGATVIALDLNSERLEMCRHNAKIYGVEDRITFICEDVFEKLAQMKADNEKVDAIFLAPPWGGQFYEQTKFDIRMMPVDGMKLFKKAEELCGNIAIYLPRNVDTNQVRNLCESGCEIAKNRLYGKIKSVTCYYGNLNMFKKKMTK